MNATARVIRADDVKERRTSVLLGPMLLGLALLLGWQGPAPMPVPVRTVRLQQTNAGTSWPYVVRTVMPEDLDR